MIWGHLDHQFPLLCRAMGRPELATDDRFKDIAGRARNRDELNGIVQGWIDAAPSDEEVLALLEEHRVPHAPVLSVEEAINHPHLRARGTGPGPRRGPGDYRSRAETYDRRRPSLRRLCRAIDR